MQDITIVIVLLAVVTALAEVTDKVRIPYPILLVVAAIAIGLIPGLPTVTLHPEIVFLIFLPPILYAAAWTTSWPDFKKAKRPITLLAIGCVIFTTCAVAFIAHYLIPELSWAEAFVLGAIISAAGCSGSNGSHQGTGRTQENYYRAGGRKSGKRCDGSYCISVRGCCSRYRKL